MTPTYLLSGLWETYSESKIRGVSLLATDSSLWYAKVTAK